MIYIYIYYDLKCQVGNMFLALLYKENHINLLSYCNPSCLTELQIPAPPVSCAFSSSFWKTNKFLWRQGVNHLASLHSSQEWPVHESWGQILVKPLKYWLDFTTQYHGKACNRHKLEMHTHAEAALPAGGNNNMYEIHSRVLNCQKWLS